MMVLGRYSKNPKIIMTNTTTMDEEIAMKPRMSVMIGCPLRAGVRDADSGG